MPTKKVFCKRCGELNRFDRDDAVCVCDECRADVRFFDSPGTRQSYVFTPNPALQAAIHERRKGSGCMDHIPGGNDNLEYAGVEALDYRKLIEEFRRGGMPVTDAGEDTKESE